MQATTSPITKDGNTTTKKWVLSQTRTLECTFVSTGKNLIQFNDIPLIGLRCISFSKKLQFQFSVVRFMCSFYHKTRGTQCVAMIAHLRIFDFRGCSMYTHYG